MIEFLNKISEILDVDHEISMNTELATIDEWDSLSVVSFAAMANASYGKKLLVKDIEESKTIADLYAMIIKDE